MSLNAWTRELGTEQGRIEPLGWVPPEGTFAFVLGFDKPFHTERLKLYDYCEVHQTATLGVTLAGNTKLIRLSARLRSPATQPDGTAWKFSLLIDDVERAFHILRTGETRDRVDMAANVSMLSGSHKITARVELVPA